uniref:Uncharacterized protein n=1 Tax=Anguilla anguilla TaxID=7936 RepID=A0A0E9U3Z1_ANGAN
MLEVGLLVMLSCSAGLLLEDNPSIRAITLGHGHIFATMSLTWPVTSCT